jgi:acyl-homoserine-lactone acylase
MNPYNEDIYVVKWNDKNPRTTPDGLADPKKAVAALDKVAAKIKSDFGTLAVPWGDAFRIRSRTVNLPANGAEGTYGSFRVTWPGGEENHVKKVGGGDSWVGIIEFGEKIRANVLLSYGNSSQDDSPHNGDQLKLYSDKKLREAHFYPKDVEVNKKRREVFKNGGFISE